MPWFRVDDAWWSHPKVLGLSLASRGLWVTAGSYCAQHPTDGLVSRQLLRVLGGTARLAGELTEAGLWATEADGWRFHDWLTYQPSAEEVAAGRAATHEARVRAGRSGGLASGQARAKQKPSKTEAKEEAKEEAETKQTGSKKEAPTLPIYTEPNGSARIVAHWLDHCAERPPDRVVGQLAKTVGGLLAEGYPTDRVERAVAEWNRRGLHPSSLPSVYHELSEPRSNGQRRSAVAGMLDLAERLADQTRELGP